MKIKTKLECEYPAVGNTALWQFFSKKDFRRKSVCWTFGSSRDGLHPWRKIWMNWNGPKFFWKIELLAQI